MKKTVVKVNIKGDKCKRGILKATAKLDGINQMSVDVEKGTLTVIGEVDPIMIVEQLRKSSPNMKSATIVSVGPPPKKLLSSSSDDQATNIQYYPPFSNYYLHLPPSQQSWGAFDRW